MIEKALPLKGRKRRRVKVKKPFVPAAQALALVGATYDAAAWTVTLTFGRAIDISAFDAEQVTVLDGAINNLALRGMNDPGPQLITPTTVEISLTDIGEFTGGDVRMTATATTGIVADDDGGTWAGVTELALPFG